MVTKYWATNEVIRQKEYLGETNKTVLTGSGNTVRKNGSWYAIKDTFDEAKEYLLQESRHKIQQYEQLVQEEQARYMRIKNLQP